MIYYNSRDPECKKPFGAVKAGTEVYFLLKADLCEYAFIVANDKKHKMQPCENGFETSISFDSPGLIFYYFELHTQNGITVYAGKGGSSAAYFSLDIPEKYQLTVYSRETKVPKWYSEGIVYQIFPDRFNIGGEVIKAKKDAHYYKSADEIPQYIKNGNDIAKWDFYGGNLKGICEKLSYLKELGVTCIYLNPIFEARSNHRYDTGNYLKIDPMLGSEEDFDKLISDAGKLGIKIILDGVFNHTGADSIYFNRFGSYDSIGAYQGIESPYYNWYTFTSYPEKYEGWWGVDDLPCTNENVESFRKFLITDQNSVINKWTSKGIGGWRLDVADELSDELLLMINQTVKSKNPDTVVIGEVWEDASNKIAYDKRKNYFTQPELDCVMNYPFRDNLIPFMKGELDAHHLADTYMTLMENYPAYAFYGGLNSLGTHDVERIASVAKDISEENFYSIMKSFVMCQFVFPGVPCIYYGDEAGLEGRKDPDNRRMFPWGKENQDIFAIYKKASGERAKRDALKCGKTEFLSFGTDVFGILRTSDDDTALLYINRSGLPVDFICKKTGKEIHLAPWGCYYE